LGYLFVSAFTILLVTVSKNYITSIFIPISSIAVWIYFFKDNATGYYFPFALLKTVNFFSGNLTDIYDAVGAENVVYFKEIPLSVLISIVLFAVIFIIFAIFNLCKSYKSCKSCSFKKAKISKIKTVSTLISVAILSGILSGCNNSYPENLNINMNDSSENQRYIFRMKVNENEKNSLQLGAMSFTGNSTIILAVDKQTNTTFNPIRNVFKTPDVEFIQNIFCTEDYLYYSTPNSIFQIDLENFSEKRVYFKEVEDYAESKYLDLLVFQNAGSFFMIHGFFVVGDDIFIATSNSLLKYNIRSKNEETLIEEDCHFRVAFDGRKIYYLDAKSNLKFYDISTEKITTVSDDFWSDMVLFEGYIYLTNRFELTPKLFRIKTENILNGEREEIAKIDISSIDVEKDNLYFISQEEKTYKLVGNKIEEITE
jgi:hypothetical protein